MREQIANGFTVEGPSYPARSDDKIVGVGLVRTLNVEIDLDRRTMRREGILVALLGNEMDVLAILARNAGSIVSLLDLQKATSQNALMVRSRVGMLRQRLEDDPKHPRLITTIGGRGYRLKLAE